MSDLGFYENVIPQISKKKLRVMKICASVITSIAIALWILQSIPAGRTFVPIFLVSLGIAIIPVVIFGFLCTDLEISITQNEFSLAKIYGKRARKELFCADAEDIISVVRKTDDGISRTEDKNISVFYSAIPKDSDGQNVWLVAFRYDPKRNACIELELTDEAKKLLRAMKPSAFSVR